MKAKPGRKTNVERAQKRIHDEQVSKYEAQEARRAERVQIDQWPVLLGWIIGVAIAFLTSAVVSFNGINSVAPTVGLGAAWMSYLFFFFIEFMYLIFLVAYLTIASRGESARGPFFGMAFFAGVAIAGNAYHTLKFHNWEVTPDLIAGVILSVSAPIAILSVSKIASRLVFAQSVEKPEGL